MSEFDAVFQKKSAPKTPTVYASAPRVAHKVTAWKDHEPLFVMANAPAGDVDSSALLDRCIERLQKEGALQDETLLWSRTPKELSEVFPDTEGAIYGASSNTMFAAFQRQANKDKKIAGLYYASGSAHPGGGVPLCLRSGLMAADACLGDDRFQKDAA